MRNIAREVVCRARALTLVGFGLSAAFDGCAVRTDFAVSVDDGGAVDGCGAGYEPSEDKNSCQDIDECVDGTHACGDHGTCTNMPAGSYSCDCDEGYSENVNGAGQATCTRTGACEAGMDNCVDNADHGTCTSTGGARFTCGCMAGYAGDGVRGASGGTGCTRIPRCSTDGNCGPRQTCNDTATGIEGVCEAAPSGCPGGETGTFCSNDTVRTCVSDSDGCVYIDGSQDEDCVAQGLVCNGGACTCNSGDIRCLDGSSPQGCMSGQWTDLPQCSSRQNCRQDQGCVDNDPQDIGNTTVNGTWTDWQPSTTRAYFIPITVNRDWLLLKFRLHGRQSGSICKMAIYDDSNGNPGDFLTATASDITVAVGVSGGGPASLSTQLSAGSTYWIGVKCWAPSGTAELYQKSVPTAEYFRTLTTTYAAAFSDNPSGMFRSGVALPFFIQVEEIPD